MFKNFLIAALRSFRRNRFHSILNLLGLGFGTAIFIVVLLYARHELSYDKFNENYSRIFRLDNIQDGVKWSSSNAILGPDLVESIPEIESFTRTSSSYKKYIAKFQDNVVNLDKVVYHDSTVFEIFTYEFLSGNAQDALKTPLSIVLTETMAKRIFGEAEAYNQILKIDDEYDFIVTGVVKDLPNQSHVNPQAIISIENLKIFRNDDKILTYSGAYNYYTYLLVKSGSDIREVNDKANQFLIDEYGWDEANSNIYLSSLKEVYFEPAENYVFKQGNLNQVYIFLAIGVITLFIAIINYVNLTTSQALIRAKELGIRKVLGSHRRYIAFQLIVEAIFLTIIAVNLSLLFVELIKPYVNNLLDCEITIGYFKNPNILILIILFGILLGFISGIFPAIYISKFDALKSMNNEVVHGRLGQKLRQFLIIFQFLVASFLITATLIVMLQMHFIQKYDLGFDKEKLLYLMVDNKLESKKDVFREKLIQYSGIENVSYSYASYRLFYERWGSQLDTLYFMCHIEIADPYYVETLGLDIVEGRNFSKEMQSDLNKVLLNESAAQMLFQGDAVGKEVYRREVIGIVKDYSFETLHFTIEPLVIVNNPFHNIVTIRYNQSDLSSVLAHLEKVWNELSIESQLRYEFVDNYYYNKYKKEIKSRKLFLIIALSAILIACLGVIGLVTYSIQRRMKEIGIRKVNGAFASHVMILLSKEVTNLITIATLLSIPFSWFLMNKWLENFAFRIVFPIWIFPIVFLLVWLISLMSIGFQSYKTARINPVEILRYE